MGPAESPEFASVTNELAPTLGPELATLFKTVSPDTGPRLDRGFPGIKFDEFAKDELKWALPTMCDCPSPWKKMPEVEGDCAIPPVTRECTIAGAFP